MNTFIKKCREEAGLTQEKFAEKMKVSVVTVQNWEKGRQGIRTDRLRELSAVFIIPVDKLIKELLIEEDRTRSDNWPEFLFDDYTNSIIDTLHLNIAQQDLFGLLYIYGADYLDKEVIDYDTFDEDLRVVPYGFIDKVGSIQFMNQAEGLHEVLRYIKKDFLMKVLKQDPEAEFNIRKLPKELICEFIDKGYKPLDDTFRDIFADNLEDCAGLNFRINMNKAGIILPVLEKVGPVHLTEDTWASEIRKDIPEELLTAILDANGYDRDIYDKGYYHEAGQYHILTVRYGLEYVTEYKNISEKGQKECWMWSINEKGRKLIKWLNE